MKIHFVMSGSGQLDIQYLIAHIVILLIQEMCETVNLVFVIVDDFDMMTDFGYNLIFLDFV